MNTTPLHQQLFALGLSALVTAGILFGNNGLAHHYGDAAAHQAGVWAAAPALPASATLGAALNTQPGSCPAPAASPRVLA